MFVEYLSNLFKTVPFAIYHGLALVFVIGTIIFLILYGYKKGFRCSLGILLLEYVFLLLCSTVLFRTYREPPGINLLPLWSYREAIIEGSHKILFEIIMNIVVFIPIGFLLGCLCKDIRWWKVILISGFISFTIECLQYIYERGFAETDDLINIILGASVGFCFYSIGKKLFEGISKSASVEKKDVLK